MCRYGYKNAGMQVVWCSNTRRSFSLLLAAVRCTSAKESGKEAQGVLAHRACGASASGGERPPDVLVRRLQEALLLSPKEEILLLLLQAQEREQIAGGSDREKVHCLRQPFHG